jgi:UDP-N-acetylglucosamine 2-epimerase (non-hydrolysing)
MNDVFFEQLGLPQPDLNLGIGSGSHGRQTADMLVALEDALLEYRPDMVMCVGDVNSTLAAALAAAKLHVPVAHVEAGLRSYDRRMPEEINRVVADHVSDLLFATSEAAARTLRNEGIAAERIHTVGNTMIDTLMRFRDNVDASAVLERSGLAPRSYCVVTMHRPSNVDGATRCREIVEALCATSAVIPLAIPLHARTRDRLEQQSLLATLKNAPGVRLTDALGYLEFLGLLSTARLVVTDSGGVQAESAVLGIPCVTLRDTTEWVETVESGMNELLPPDRAQELPEIVKRTLARNAACRPLAPPLWDGQASVRIISLATEWLRGRGVGHGSQ